MAEDLDVEAMLEAPVDSYKKDSGLGSINGDSPLQEKNGSIKEYSSERERERRKKHKKRSRSRSHDRKKKSKRSRSKDKERERRHRGSRSRSHDRDRDHDRESRVSRRDRRSSRSPSRERGDRFADRRDHRRRSPSPRGDRFDRRGDYGRRGGGGGGYYDRRSSTPREDLPIEERDQRTVFCMQLAARVRQRDIEDFFSKVGRVREVRLIMDNRTRRHKGIAYVEFKAIDSVGKAIALTGTRLCGVPIVVQHSQAEKNRLAAQNASAKTTGATGSGLGAGNTIGGSRNGGFGSTAGGPMSLYVGSLHFNITEDMLRGIFEPFGHVEKIELSRDPESGRSKGYGFVHFKESDDAKKALEQLNGFELAGRPMKVNYVTEKSDNSWNNGLHGPGALDSDELDRGGIELGAAGRLQLMAKLAEGTGIELPKSAMDALHMSSQSNNSMGNNTFTSASASQNNSTLIPPIATQCFLLTNMFDRHNEASASWPEDIRNDVIEECRNHGGVLHVYVDQTSDEGHVYVKCTSIASATATVNALHGRWFAGRLITAAFVPVVHYHNLFPESAVNTTPLVSSETGSA